MSTTARANDAAWRTFGQLLVLATYALCQWPGLNAPFSHGDDQLELAFVNGLESVRQFLGVDVFGLFRPVKNLLFAFFSAVSAHGMLVCRLTALGIGIGSFWAVKAFAFRIFRSRGQALLAAAVWLLAPTLVSSTVWLSCVNIQIMCACAAWAGLCHLDDRPLRAAECLLLACLSYEQAVIVGPCLVVCDFFLRPERLRQRRTWGIYALYAALTLAYLAVRSAVGSSHLVNGSFVGCSRFDLCWASAYLTGLHFSTWFWPFGRMAVFGSYAAGQVAQGLLIFCWMCTILGLMGIFALRRRCTVLALGLAWAWVAFLPLGNLAGLRNGPYGDYYLGLSAMGFAWAGVALADKALHMRPGILRAIARATVGGFFFIRLLAVGESFAWAHLWACPEAAYRATVRTFPKAYFAHVTLARHLCDAGRYAEAEAECDRAEAEVGDEGEKLASIHIVRALCAILGRRDPAEAEQWLDRAAREDQRAQNARLCHFYRGCVWEDLRNDAARAEREYAAAIPDDPRWDPDAVRAVDRYARLLALRGAYAQAIPLWEKALRITPADAVVAQNLRTARRLAKKAKDR